jgi:hypothetical protein
MKQYQEKVEKNQIELKKETIKTLNTEMAFILMIK